MDSYTNRQAADKAFNRIMNLTGDSSIYNAEGINGFWQQGNALSTCLDYLIFTGQKDNEKATNFQPIVKNAIVNVFAQHLFDIKVNDKRLGLWPSDPSNPEKPQAPWDPSLQIDPSKWTSAASVPVSETKGPPGPWLDDYGWWGIAVQKAYQFSDRLGYDKQFSDCLLTLSRACWEALYGSWDEPPLPQGAWNCKYDKWALTGRNCVTNELLWLLSQCLRQSLPNEQKFVDQNKRSQNWFLDADRREDLLSKDGLILERFRDIGNGMPNWTWAGDQGLFTAACMGSPSAGGDNLVDLATKISAAVESKLMDAGKVIHDHKVPLSDFILDYATGKGVYLRCWSRWNGKNYNQLILNNAQAVWNNRNPPPDEPFEDPDPETRDFQFGFNWNPQGRPYDPNNPDSGEPNYLPFGGAAALRFSLLILQASGMAALNAALLIAPDRTINS